MAHAFESGVFFGNAAWHGLGTTLAENDARRQSVQGTLTAAGLDWRVERHAVAIAGGRFAGTPVPDRYAVVRDTDGALLGNVGERYHVLQNAEMFEWFTPFLESGAAQFETAGALHGGRVVWILARLNDVADADVGGGDFVRPYLMLSSSHDGTLATRMGFTPVRIVCANTLAAAHSDAKSALLKVKHTANQREAMALVRETIDTVRGEFAATAAQYRALQAVKISETDLVRYVRKVLELPEIGGSTRAETTVSQICNLALYGRGQFGERTAWSAYNGVTEYLSYRAGRKQSNRLASLWGGKNAQTNARALELALTL